MVLVVKNTPVNAGETGDASLIPEWGRSPGEGHGNPLQYSYLENPMDRGAWWATVHTFTHDLSNSVHKYMFKMIGQIFFFFNLFINILRRPINSLSQPTQPG